VTRDQFEASGIPELLELGDDPDDALRRMREAIERRAN